MMRIVFWGEDNVRRRLSQDELHDRVARLAAALRAWASSPATAWRRSCPTCRRR